MKYCRFRFENHVMYGVVDDRGGEPWIVDLADAPEEDLVAHLTRARLGRERDRERPRRIRF